VSVIGETTGDRQKSGMPLNILPGLNLPDLTQSPALCRRLKSEKWKIENC
jgi:hypothetical protein